MIMKNANLGKQLTLPRIRGAFLAAYVSVAAWEYSFGASLYGGWFFFHLMKLTVYMIMSTMLYYGVCRYKRVNAVLVVIMLDIICLPVVYLLFEA